MYTFNKFQSDTDAVGQGPHFKIIVFMQQFICNKTKSKQANSYQYQVKKKFRLMQRKCFSYLNKLNWKNRSFQSSQKKGEMGLETSKPRALPGKCPTSKLKTEVGKIS